MGGIYGVRGIRDEGVWQVGIALFGVWEWDPSRGEGFGATSIFFNASYDLIEVAFMRLIAVRGTTSSSSRPLVN